LAEKGAFSSPSPPSVFSLLTVFSSKLFWRAHLSFYLFLLDVPVPPASDFSFSDSASAQVPHFFSRRFTQLLFFPRLTANPLELKFEKTRRHEHASLSAYSFWVGKRVQTLLFPFWDFFSGPDCAELPLDRPAYPDEDVEARLPF